MNTNQIVKVSRILTNGVLYIGYDRQGNNYPMYDLEDYYRLAPNIEPKNYDTTDYNSRI